MQIGIAAYLRHLAQRCAHVARQCPDLPTAEALEQIGRDLADKAEVLETTFAVPADHRRPLHKPARR